MNTFERLLLSQNMRQAAIDYLIENPGAYAPDICSHFGWKISSGASRLAAMADDGELSREDAIYVQKYPSGTRRQASFKYYALVKQTKQAVDVIRAMGKNLASLSGTRPTKHSEDEPYTPKPIDLGKARYVHDDSRRPALSGQGGQGGIGARLTATSLELMP